MSSGYEDIWYQSKDGLKLHARDYAQSKDDSPFTLLCIHGLTRNAADFEELCEQLKGNYRLVVAEQRGRGQSQWDINPVNYNPSVYVGDMFALMAYLKLEKVVFIGTSMGGLMAMMMGAMQSDKIQGMVLNDIGPEVSTEGLERLKTYVGKGKPVDTWAQAAEAAEAINGRAFPDYSKDDWLHFARKIYREEDDGKLVLNYDPSIALPMAAASTTPAEIVPLNLWPMFDALADIPLLLVRGETSDILDKSCVEKMQEKKPDMQYVEVPNRGHAPMLDEPEAVEAIKNFLASL